MIWFLFHHNEHVHINKRIIIWFMKAPDYDRSKIQKSADCLNFVNCFDDDLPAPWRGRLLCSVQGTELWSAVCFMCSLYESILIKRHMKAESRRSLKASPAASRREAELLSVEQNVCCKWKVCCVWLSLWFPGYQTAPAHIHPPQVTLLCSWETDLSFSLLPPASRPSAAEVRILLIYSRLNQHQGSPCAPCCWGFISSRCNKLSNQNSRLCDPEALGSALLSGSVCLMLLSSPQNPSFASLESAAAAIFSPSTSCCFWRVSVSSAEVSDVWVSYKSAQCFYESSSRISLSVNPWLMQLIDMLIVSTPGAGGTSPV